MWIKCWIKSKGYYWCKLSRDTKVSTQYTRYRSIHKSKHKKIHKVFPDNSVGKESICSVGDPGSIPGLGRSPGEGIGYPIHYSWASLVAQLVKNPPAMRETWLLSLGWEDSPGEGKGYPLQYSDLENSIDCIYSPWDCKESDRTKWLSLSDKSKINKTTLLYKYVKLPKLSDGYIFKKA